MALSLDCALAVEASVDEGFRAAVPLPDPDPAARTFRGFLNKILNICLILRSRRVVWDDCGVTRHDECSACFSHASRMMWRVHRDNHVHVPSEPHRRPG